MTRRLRSIPVPVIVGLVTALWAAWLARWSADVDSYVWMIDELLYAKAATFYTDGLHLRPELFGHSHSVPNLLYPLVQAPGYALFGSVTAFHLAHVLNAVFFASTLVPVYLLGRRVLGLAWGYALAAGFASVAVPWAVAVNVVMTESLAYPAFAWALLAMAAALARPSWKRDGLALLAIAVATLARNQFFLLAPVFVIAALLHATSTAPVDGPAPTLRERLAPHAALFAVSAVALLGLIALLAAGVDVAGAYSDALGHEAFPPGIWVATGRHLAHLVVGVGVLPAILFFAWLARALVAPAGRTEHGFAAIALLTFAVFAHQVGYFAQNVGGGGYQERYIFYLVPLLALGAIALVADRRRVVAPALIAFGAVLSIVFIVAADPQYPAGESISAFSRVANAGSAFNEALEGHIRVWSGRLLGRTLSTIDGLTVAAGLIAVLAAVLLTPRWARWARPALAVLVVAGGAGQAIHLVPKSSEAIDAAFPYVLAHVREFDRDWADQAAPDDAKVGLMAGFLGSGDDRLQWQWHTFWNKRIERLFELPGRPEIAAFTSNETRVDPSTGRVIADTDGVTHLILAGNDPSLRLRGRTVASTPDGAALFEPETPWRADWQISGVGRSVQHLLVYPTAPGDPVRGTADLVIRLPDEAKRDVRVRVRGDGRAIEHALTPNSEFSVRVRFASDGGRPAAVLIVAESEREGPVPAVSVRETHVQRAD